MNTLWSVNDGAARKGWVVPDYSLLIFSFENEIKHINKKSETPDSPSMTAETVIPAFIILNITIY